LWGAEVITEHPANNITDNIFQKMGANLHRRPDHPLCIIKSAIYDFFDRRQPGVFSKFDDLYPVVSTKANFDDVLIPKDHVSRNPNETYYIDSETVLRCHTSGESRGRALLLAYVFVRQFLPIRMGA
jgi:phenylalanyl-tRNA synthetase alpha chain